MFTGLIETVGSVKEIKQKGDVTELTISAPAISKELKNGDSVSVSGACSTVTAHDAGSFSIELMPETMARTKAGAIARGISVNLERAMRMDSRLDGHLVAGHVDGTAVLTKTEDLGSTRKLHFAASEELLDGIVPKGSVTIDGISLTVIDAGKGSFSVGVIPTTLSDTTISRLKAGETVNIETDMIGKYIKKYMETRFEGKNDAEKMKNPLTWDKLTKYGWN